MGATAFTAYTPRKSGLPVNHDALQRAQSFLAERRPQKVYDAASMLLFLDSLGGKTHRGRIHRLADWLEEATDPKTYLWAYPAGQVDLSNSQFAALGGAHPESEVVRELLRDGADLGGERSRGCEHNRTWRAL